MSAAYKQGATSALAHAGPCQLVAVSAARSGEAATVSIYDGVSTAGDLALTLAVNGSSAAFCPAVPIALRNGLYVESSNGCEYTVVWV
jgi:hypothetical protein